MTTTIGVIHPLQSKALVRQMIVFGNPGDKRTEGIQQARSRLGLPPAIVVPYAELLQGRSLSALLEEHFSALLEEHSKGRPGVDDAAPAHPLRRHAADHDSAAPLLRLEAPGGSFDIERALIALGAPDAGCSSDELHPYAGWPDPRPLSASAARQLKELPGVLHHPSQWFRGYCRMLARIKDEAQQLLPGAQWINDPADIAAMTDKRRAQSLLRTAGVPIPRPLGADRPPVDYASLREMMQAERMHRVFIKLACGSAASGVIAYQLNPVTGAEIALTTVGVEDYITRPPVYYNSGKLRRYTDSAAIASIINWLYRHGAYAEQWVPKAVVDGRSFDIRQLIACGEAGHAVARASTTPITNLHLRSRRMSPLEAGLSPEVLAQVQDTARLALTAFPHSHIAGVDVLLSGNLKRTYIADVNPFGDLLYHVLHDGLGTYEWEMKLLAKSDASAKPAIPTISP